MQKHQPFGWVKWTHGANAGSYVQMERILNYKFELCGYLGILFDDAIKNVVFTDGTPFRINGGIIMDAKELMIGDYVKTTVPFGNNKIDTFKVVSLRKDGVDLINGTIQTYRYYDELIPIKISEESFEKNEWKKEKIIGEFDLGILFCSPNKRVIANNLDSNLKEWSISIDNERHCSIGYIECNYIHELQHALRLYGLDEIADNFKVE